METCIIKSPLGFTKIVGDEDGVASVIVLNKIELSEGESNSLSFPRKWESICRSTRFLIALRLAGMTEKGANKKAPPCWQG